ncbi:hypothetical protein LX36DRAFT_649748 [Colletotrichum falcatum]|nr:hypothetical protein LX36DRAFT_649748 [Colletotrichum falcatum]
MRPKKQRCRVPLSMVPALLLLLPSFSNACLSVLDRVRNATYGGSLEYSSRLLAILQKRGFQDEDAAEGGTRFEADTDA